MLELAFDRLFLKKQYRSLTKDRKVKIIGYDTETVKGRCELIACPSDFLHPNSIDSILQWLCRKRNRGKTGFFYNLRYDFQSILKWLPYNFWVDIHKKGKIEYGNYIISYIPKKMLVIRYRQPNGKFRRFSFYDIAQFYKGMTLDKAAKKYLNKRKLDPDVDIANMTTADCQRQDVIDYCKYDARLCQELAENFIRTCWHGGLYPTSFCSTASISSRYFMSQCDIPTINHLRNSYRGRSMLHMAWLSYAGAFITVFKRGYFKNVYEYDINSAYPYGMANLPDIRDGQFIVKSGEPYPSLLGWLKVKVNLNESSVGFYHPPFPMLRRNLPNYMPSGTFETYITLLEYQAYSKDFDIEPIAGLYWIPFSNPRYPFRAIVNHLYNERQTTNDDNLNYFYKICLNAFYGKNLERNLIRDEDHDFYSYFETGNFFNPFYASYIVACTRVQIYNALKTISWKNQIGCFTDSVLTLDPLPLPLNKELGQWDLASKGELLMVGCGVYTMRGEKLKSKVRGFHTTSKIDLIDIFRQHSDLDEIGLKVKMNVSPITSIIQKRPKEMNYIETVDRKININFDSKRRWQYKFRCAAEILEKTVDSLPIDYGIMQKILKGG